MPRVSRRRLSPRWKSDGAQGRVRQICAHLGPWLAAQVRGPYALKTKDGWFSSVNGEVLQGYLRSRHQPLLPAPAPRDGPVLEVVVAERSTHLHLRLAVDREVQIPYADLLAVRVRGCGLDRALVLTLSSGGQLSLGLPFFWRASRVRDLRRRLDVRAVAARARG